MKYNLKQSKKNRNSKEVGKSRKHFFYKMKGCSKKMRTRHHSKKIHGGKGDTNVLGADFNLAYPYNGPVLPNPALAYQGKGGYKCPDGLAQSDSRVPFPLTSNVNGVNPLYPNTGPIPNGLTVFNSAQFQRGGNCGCSGGLNSTMSGGVRNRVNKHRLGCKCSMCKMTNMNGGGSCSTSNNGIPYPNGLVGERYLNPSNLPGANGIPGDANYYLLNDYKNDISRQMIDVGANPPFLGYRGGKRQASKQTRRHRGGTFSNFLGQDLINLGRQFTYGIGSAYNSLNGYPAPTNPLPWKGQLPDTASLSTVKNI